MNISYLCVNSMIGHLFSTTFSFDYLGWYRKDGSGDFVVHHGLFKMQKIHSVKVKNCREQKLQSYLDALHYVDKSGEIVSIFFWLA